MRQYKEHSFSDPAEFDCEITLRSSTTARNAFGEVERTYSDAATVRAKREYISRGTNAESLQQGRQAVFQAIAFTFWKMESVSDTMNESWKIVHDSKTYDIEEIQEIEKNRILRAIVKNEL